MLGKKGRNVAGFALIGALGIGMYLGGLFKGFGLGGGGIGGAGSGSGVTSGTSVGLIGTNGPTGRPLPDLPEENQVVPESNRKNRPSSPATEGDFATNTIDLLIDGRKISNYSAKSGRAGDELDFAQIVERAKQVVGNDDGIKVRIYRMSTSRPSAEQELARALQNAGFKEDQIQMIPGMVDRRENTPSENENLK